MVDRYSLENPTTDFSNMERLVSCIKLMRPKHWAKNSFLFIPLFFAGKLLDFDRVQLLLQGFVAFSLIASSIYIINDYRDIEKDRMHPEKSKRPLASGAVSKPLALALFFTLVAVGGTVAFFLSPKFLFILGIYFFLNVAYTFGLKNVSILDMIIVSAGFVLRIKAGGAAGDVGTSEWLTVMIFLLAMFMTIAKRRDDVLLKIGSGKDMRKVVKSYNMDYLNILLAIIGAITIVSYIVYTVTPAVHIRFDTHRLYYTALFVIAGIMRYLQLVFIDNDSGSPTKILYKDRFIQGAILCWILSFYFIIYFPNIQIFE